jgi:hypothetical protein
MLIMEVHTEGSSDPSVEFKDLKSKREGESEE